MRAITLHEIGDEDATGQVVVALVLAAAVWIVNDVERLHELVIGTSHRFLDADFAFSVPASIPAQLMQALVVDAQVVGHLVEDSAADLISQLVAVEAQ